MEHLALSGPEFSHLPLPLLDSAAGLVPARVCEQQARGSSSRCSDEELPTTEDVKMCLALWVLQWPCFSLQRVKQEHHSKGESLSTLLFFLFSIVQEYPEIVTFRATVLRLIEGTGFTVILSKLFLISPFWSWHGSSCWMKALPFGLLKHTLHNFSGKL